MPVTPTRHSHLNVPSDLRRLISRDVLASDAAPTAALAATEYAVVSDLTSVVLYVYADNATGTGNSITITPWRYTRNMSDDPLGGVETVIWQKGTAFTHDLGYDGATPHGYVIDTQNADRIFFQVTGYPLALAWLYTDIYVHTARRDIQPVLVSGMESALRSVFPFSARGLIVDTELRLDATNVFIDNLFVYATNTALPTTAGFALMDSTKRPVVDIGALADNAINLGAGAAGTGTQRVILASNDPAVTSLAIIDDWDDGADACKSNVMKLNGNAISLNAGALEAGTQRITIATDDALHTRLGANGAVASSTGSQSAQLRAIWDAIKSLGAGALPATHTLPADGTVAFTSNVSVTCAGTPFVVDATNCFVSWLAYKPAAGVWTLLVNCINGLSLTAAANVITVAGGGTPFAAGDTYAIGLVAQNKGYTLVTDSNRTEEINPINFMVIEESLVDTTNLAADTYYPSANGMVMLGYKDLSLTGRLLDCTVTVQGMNDEDLAAGNWVTVYGYDAVNNAVVNSIVGGAVATDFAFDFDNLNYRYVRVYADVVDATNTVIIKARRKAL